MSDETEQAVSERALGHQMQMATGPHRPDGDSERRKVVFCHGGYYSVHRHRCHHLGEAASLAGWDVTFVIPTDWLTLARSRSLRCRDQAALPFSFRHVCAVPPFRLQRRSSRLKQWARASTERQVLKMADEFADALVIVQDYDFPLTVLSWRRSCLISDIVDDFLHMAGRQAREQELKIARGSDAIVVSAAGLTEAFERCGRPMVYIPNGVDSKHYEGVFDLPRTSRRAVFMGTVGPWVDLALLRDVALRMPEWEFLVAGSVAPGCRSSVAWPANVAFVGRKPYAELPQLLKGCSVGLIPFKLTDPVAQGADPLKFYEYLAAGLAVVATPIPQLARFRDAARVRLARGAEEFAAAIETGFESLGSPQARDAARDLVHANTWQARWRAFERCYCTLAT